MCQEQFEWYSENRLSIKLRKLVIYMVVRGPSFIIFFLRFVEVKLVKGSALYINSTSSYITKTLKYHDAPSYVFSLIITRAVNF